MVAFGTAALGDTAVSHPNAPVVAMAATPDGQGYWVATADGGVFTFGNAPFFGSADGDVLNKPIVGMAATPDGLGYWLVAADGGLFTFGDAPFLGSTGAVDLNKPIVGMAATNDGLGYWLVAADGGMFAFGDAAFFGSTGAIALNRPIVGMARTPDGLGYWLVAADGGIFTFGDAPFLGSAGSVDLDKPITGMAATPDGLGYWLVAADGGLFTFGDAPFLGSEAGIPLTVPVVALASAPGGTGYWMAVGDSPLDGPVSSYVDGRDGVVTAAVYDVATGQSYDLRPGVAEDEASMVKVDILGTLLSQLGDPPALPAATQSLATAMIEDSDNNAATALWNEDGGSAGVAVFNQRIGMRATDLSACCWGLSTTTPEDQLDLLRHIIIPNAVLDFSQRLYALGLMERVNPAQAWGISGGVPAGVTVALKNGWLPLNGNGDWQVNSIGWVDGDGRDYLIAVETTGNPSEGYGISTIEDIASHVWAASA